MYEHRSHPLLTRRQFAIRMLRHGGVAAAGLVFSLAIGVIGFAGLGHMEYLDAFLNSAMLLGGMGPVGPFELPPAGKLFAALYALYAGIAFLGGVAVLMTPIVHRMMHRLHLEPAKGRK